LPGIAEARIPLMWAALDRAQRLGLAVNAWHPVGLKRPLDD
jgi:hypothetical protein